MSTGAEVSSPAKSLTPPAPQLRFARFEDYEGIARVGLAQSLVTQPLEDWRSIWLDNPLWRRLGKDWPIGWVLETTTGEIVGSVVNVPSLYRFRGQDLICGNGRAWAVTTPYRGYALWLMDEYFNQPGVDLFINTTVGTMAAPIIGRLSARIPVGDWETISYWVTGHVERARGGLERRRVPLAGWLAYPAGGALWLKDAIRKKPFPKLARGVLIETADRFDSRFDVFWDELVWQNSEILLAERNSRALSWHFGIPMRRGRLWIFTASRNHQLRAYCVLSCKGDGGHVQLIDYQTIEPEVDLLPGLVQAALRRCVKEDMFTLQNFGRGVPKMRALDECAPYREKNPSWRFYYRAADPGLDTELRAARFWDPSAYDGDASYE